MRLKAILKKGLNMFFKDKITLVLSFLIFPMVLALVYGSMNKNLAQGEENSIEAINVNIKYNQNSSKGNILNQILSKEEIQSFIIQGKADIDYTVSINDDFTEFEISEDNQNSLKLDILKNFTQAVLNNINEFEIVQSTVYSLKISEVDKQILLKNITEAINQNSKKSMIKEQIIDGYKTLSSIEYFTISFFSFTSLIMVITLAGYFFKEVREGIFKRTLSTSVSKIEYFTGFLMNSFFLAFIISLLYVGINRLRGVAFFGNLFCIILIILLQCLLCASTAGIIIVFIKKELTANLIFSITIALTSMVGGVFFYGDIIKSKVFRAIMNLMPNSLILNIYKEFAITQSLNSIKGELIAMLLVSVLFLSISIIKLNYKWEA